MTCTILTLALLTAAASDYSPEAVEAEVEAAAARAARLPVPARHYELVWGGPAPDLHAVSREVAMRELSPEAAAATVELLTQGIKGLPLSDRLGRPVMEAITRAFPHTFVSMQFGESGLDDPGTYALQALSDDVREAVLAGEGWVVLMGFSSPDTDAPSRRERRRNWRLADERVFAVRGFLMESQDIPSQAILAAPVGQHDTFFPAWRDVGSACPSQAADRGGPRKGSQGAEAGCRQGVMVVYVTRDDINDLQRLRVPQESDYAFTAAGSPWSDAPVTSRAEQAAYLEDLAGLDLPELEYRDIVPPRITDESAGRELAMDTDEARGICDAVARDRLMFVESVRRLQPGDVVDLEAYDVFFNRETILPGHPAPEVATETRTYLVDLNVEGDLGRASLKALSWAEPGATPQPGRRDRELYYVTFKVAEAMTPTASLSIDALSDEGYALSELAVGALEGRSFSLSLGGRDRVTAYRYPGMVSAVRWIEAVVDVTPAYEPYETLEDRGRRRLRRADRDMAYLNSTLDSLARSRYLARVQPLYPYVSPGTEAPLLRTDLAADLAASEELLMGEEKFLANQYQLQGHADTALEALGLVGVQSLQLQCEEDLGRLLAVDR